MAQLYENKSCVAVADVDHDGDLDIFVGNLASTTGTSFRHAPDISFVSE